MRKKIASAKSTSRVVTSRCSVLGTCAKSLSDGVFPIQVGEIVHHEEHPMVLVGHWLRQRRRQMERMEAEVEGDGRAKPGRQVPDPWGGVDPGAERNAAVKGHGATPRNEAHASRMSAGGSPFSPARRTTTLRFARPVPEKCVSPKGDGGARRDRTADLVNAIHALSQLSYGPCSEIGNQQPEPEGRFSGPDLGCGSPRFKENASRRAGLRG